MEEFSFSTRIFFGEGALERLRRVQDKKVMIVTDRFMAGIGVPDKVAGHLTRCQVSVFDGVVPDPPIEVVAAGVQALQDCGAEVMIAVGGGSTIDAAKAIRERDKTGTVVMISNESCSSYNRPMLTKTMLASLTAEQIAVEPESWYEENDICQILGRTVVSVDTEKSEVILDDGSQIHFTRLIYALGSECFIPPIPGSGREQVIAVRRISDVEKIS